MQLVNEREDYQINIKELNHRYKNVMQEKDAEITKLNADMTKLRKNAHLLAMEVKKLRDQITKVSSEKETYKEALIKIKNSFYQTNVFS